MLMYNPPHPGLALADNFGNDQDVQKAAAAIGLSYDEFKRILQGQSPITPEIAFLLHEKLNLMNPEIWIGAQAEFDAWQAAHNKQWQKQVIQKFLPRQQESVAFSTSQIHQSA